MDKEDIEAQIQQVTEIGQENRGILMLAAAWCKHIDVERGPMGVGVVEQLTGLPISGGSLRCQYAEPATTFGMQLKGTAVAFYEQNCIGCPHHSPTGTTPNLGTWADEIIAVRKEEERKAEEARLEEAQRRTERRDRRRLSLGTRDPAVQALLDLVDRVDAEDRDKEAEDLLLKTAELSPQDFPDALLDHLATEAVAIRRDALLEVVFAVFERSGRPPVERVLSLAFDAIGTGLAIASAGRVIAAHAAAIPSEVRIRRGLVRLASGWFSFSGTGWTGSEPAALVRFYDLTPDAALETVASLLRESDPWMRSMGAHAAGALVKARPAAGSSLVAALLDCVVVHDGSRYHGDPFPQPAAAGVVADILARDPSIDDTIAARMTSASERDAKALWDCYSLATRSRFRKSVKDATLGVIERRAKTILESEFPPGLHADVAQTLAYQSSDPAAAGGVSLAELIGLLRTWNVKAQQADALKPPDPSPMEAFLEWQGDKLQVDGVVRNIGDALKKRVGKDAIAYIETLEHLWARTGTDALSERDRCSLVEGLSAITTQDALDRAEPTLSKALSADAPLERVSALDALARMQHRDLRFPDSLQRLVVTNLLMHDRLVVVTYAIRALPVVTVTDEERANVVERLLSFGMAYNRDALRSDEVENALAQAGRLADGQEYEARAVEVALQIVDGMFTSDAADALSHLRRLRTGPAWVASVIRALSPDDRGGNWWGVHEGRKDELLRLLAGAPGEWLAPNWDALEAAAQADLDLEGSFTWAIADLFARHGEHERAARLSQAVVDGTPDTHESRHRRGIAVLINYHHRIAAAADDIDEAERLTEEALSAGGDDDG